MPKREDERAMRGHPPACTCVDCVNRFLGKAPTSKPTYVACPTCLEGSGVIIQIRGGRIRCPTCLGMGRVTLEFLTRLNAKRDAEIQRDTAKRVRNPESGSGASAPHPPDCTCSVCRLLEDFRQRAARDLLEPLDKRPWYRRRLFGRKSLGAVPSEPPPDHIKTIYCECEMCRARRRQLRPRRRQRLASSWLFLITVIVVIAGGLFVGLTVFVISPSLTSNAPEMVNAPVQPALDPTPAPTSVPLTPDLRHYEQKQSMLNLINRERQKAGVPQVVLGDNSAAQLHAEASLAYCLSGHWGLDGLKPYMRYSLAGGYQANAENISGLDYCIRPGDGYQGIYSTEIKIRDTMEGWIYSPGHRANIVNPWHRRVSIGLAWDEYNFFAVQQFEGDYVKYTAPPTIVGNALFFAGQTKNGAIFGAAPVIPVSVFYDPPPSSLTRGQASRTYCYTLGQPVAFLRKPPPPRSYYSEDGGMVEQEVCPDPYDVPRDAPGPASYDEAQQVWNTVYSGSQDVAAVFTYVPQITASRWNVSGDDFTVTADLADVLDEHGAGVYTVVLWGTVSAHGDEPGQLSQYSIFLDVEAPSDYGIQRE